MKRAAVLLVAALALSAACAAQARALKEEPAAAEAAAPPAPEDLASALLVLGALTRSHLLAPHTLCSHTHLPACLDTHRGARGSGSSARRGVGAARAAATLDRSDG